VNISIHDLHRAFDNRIRLGIMSALAANDGMDFNALKELLDLTDGNLASHLKSLEKEGFIAVEKSFVGRKTNTRYSITPGGKAAFEQHLSVLEALIRAHQS
jgi:DNA-binding MarR family transcriptional regulator